MQKNSFQPMYKVSINVTDADMFGLLKRVVSYIHVWESAIGPALIKNGKNAMQAALLQKQQNQQNQQPGYYAA